MAGSIFPLIVLASISVLSLYRFVLHPLLFHPLRHIPAAHWSIPVFGDLWITYQRYMEKNNAVTYKAHLRYGAVVRMGANELSVNCVENGIKTIYAGGYEKHAWYPQRFGSYGVMNMFSTIHHGPHSQKKRTMANVYSKSYIASSPQVAANSHTLFSTRFLPLLQKLSETGESTDVHDMNNAIAMDQMSAYQFGLSASTNFTQDVDARRHILHQYHCRRDFEFFSAEAPWLKKLTRGLGLQIVPYYVDQANILLEDWNAAMCQAADKYLSASSSDRSSYAGDEPIVYKQFKTGFTKLREKDPNAGKAVGEVILPTTRHDNLHTSSDDTTTAEIYSEMLDQVGAGHETSAIALTYLYWEMSKNPSLQEQLREEVLTLSPAINWPLPTGSNPANDFKLPDPKQVDALPLLNAIVMETLRLHTPIPGIEPRITPNIPGGNTLGTYTNIPGGVRVSAMPYTLHRNPNVFPNPEVFNPFRWLPSHSSEDQLREMHRWFWAFGSGGRMCIGSHLALQGIKLLVSSIYSNYWTEIVNDEGIEEVDAYTTKPTRNRLDLKFTHV